MTVLELSRWQFGIATVYHFIFVPLTLSLSYLVAVGVVTGIVQEFQFGPEPEPVGGRP